MSSLGTLEFQVHLKDYTDAEADKIKKKLETLSVKLTIDGKDVTVSNTDAIKKQIEAAVKSVAISSVSVDASSVRTQIENAAKNLTPQISVTLLKGALSTDIQQYLDKKTFNIKISILKGQAQKDISTAMSTISVPVNVTVKASALIQQIQQSLAGRSVPIEVRAKDVNTFVKDLETQLGKRNVKIGLDVNKTTLKSNINNALKGQVFSADLKLRIKSTSVQDAIRDAFAKAGMKYNTTASDVRAARIAEIQQRMAMRAANAQNQLGNSYRYAAGGAYESARASVVLGRSFHTNIRLAGELGTAIGNFASVFGIKDVLQDIVQIGGQLENQKIALGAILQDGGKATDMFSRIQALAVKSPFGIMDLNQYAKQLSAYSVPYNELYDTMKRLADISAGVGVDMGRIILAFGQVKAAGFLKGTELRQFTEANIPMVDKLAERFSNLEKRIVSAGEVYDMISKKKVTFEDVKSVLWDLTGEGGMFNNMQEVLSESLASKWKNLADAIDVMYGKIAEGRVGGGLKLMAEGLTELTKNWDYLATAIGSAVAAYTAYKISVGIGSGKGAYGVYGMIAANKQLEISHLRVARSYRELTAAEQGSMMAKTRFTTAQLRQAAVEKVLTKEMLLRLVAMKKISVAQAGHLKQILGITRAEIAQAAATKKSAIAWAVLGNTLSKVGTFLKSILVSPWTWVFAGITAFAELWAYYEKKEDEMEERNKAFAESVKGSAETLERELLKLKDLDISKMNTDEMKIKVRDLTEVIQNEADGWQSILSEIFAKEADGTFKNSVEEQLRLLKAKMDELAEAKKQLMGDNESYSDVIESTETGWWFAESDIVDKLEKYSEAVEKNDKKLKELAVHHRDVASAIQIVSESNSELQEELQGKSLNEQVSLLKDYEEEWKQFGVELTKLNPEAAQTVNSWYNQISKFYVKGVEAEMVSSFTTAKNKMIDELKLQGEDTNNLSETGRQYVLKFVAGILNESAVQKPKIQQQIYNWFTEAFNLPKVDLNYQVPDEISNIGQGDADDSGSKKDAVAEMWKKRADEIAKAIKMYDDWKKVEGKQFAENRVKYKEELANLFNGKYGFNLDLENPTEAYEYIQKQLDESKEKQKELKVALGVKISDAELKDAQDELKDFLENAKKFVDNTVERWGLYKKLFESTGNKTLSMNIAFGGQLGFKNQLEQIEAEIRKTMESLGIGISFDELIKMDTQALEDAGWKGVSELIKGYNEEKKKLDKEQVDKFVDIIKSSKDFAKQIADIERELQDKLKTLREQGMKHGLGEEELKRRENKLVQNAEEEKTKVRFEEFKKSSDWVKVFDDLDRVSDATLDNMITKIEEFARQGKISEEVTKQLVEAMGKLRDEAIERNPFRGLGNAVNRVKSLINAIPYTKDGKQRYRVYNGDTVDDLSEQDRANGLAAAQEDLVASIKGIGDVFQDAQNVIDPILGVFEALGEEADGVRSILGTLANAIGAAATYSESFSNLMGIKLGSGEGAKSIGDALGIKNAGLWGAVAGASLSILSSVFAEHDKALQREIEASEAREKAIKNMADLLETQFNRNLGGVFTMKLSDDAKKALDKILIPWKYGEFFNMPNYSSDTKETAKKAKEADSYYLAQLASLKAQRDEIQHQREAELDKKDTDTSKVEDYENEIKRMEDEINNFAESMMETLYGIDFSDWANQFATSIVDAWAAGEDAATAYKNTVGDVMRNVASTMIQQAIIGKYLDENLGKILDKFEANDGVLDEEIFGMMGALAAGLEKKVEDVTEFADALETELNKHDLSMKDSESSGKGGLSKGIKNITEETADLLASYLNAVRADVSVDRTLFERLMEEDLPKMSLIAEAQLRELNLIQMNTKRNADAADKIYELVNRVVDKSGNKLKI